MFFFILNNLLEANNLSLNFVLIGGCMLYIITLNYFFSNFWCLVIPLDLFITFNFICKSPKNNIETSDKKILLRKNQNKLSNDFVIDKISIQDTLDHTFKNIGISAKNI